MALWGEKQNPFLPITEQLPASLFISVRVLQVCADAVCWAGMSVGPGASALVGSLLPCRANPPSTNETHPRKGKPYKTHFREAAPPIPSALEPPYSFHSTSRVFHRWELSEERTSPNPPAFESCLRNEMSQHKLLHCSSHTAPAVS